MRSLLSLFTGQSGDRELVGGRSWPRASRCFLRVIVCCLIYIIHIRDSPWLCDSELCAEDWLQKACLQPPLCLCDHFRVRAFIDPQLLRTVRMPAGAASPIGIGSAWISWDRVHPAAFAGTKRHHQFTTALNALTLDHTPLVPQSRWFRRI